MQCLVQRHIYILLGVYTYKVERLEIGIHYKWIGEDNSTSRTLVWMYLHRPTRTQAYNMRRKIFRRWVIDVNATQWWAALYLFVRASIDDVFTERQRRSRRERSWDEMKNPIRENPNPFTAHAKPLYCWTCSKSNATVHALERNLMHTERRRRQRRQRVAQTTQVNVVTIGSFSWYCVVVSIDIVPSFWSLLSSLPLHGMPERNEGWATVTMSASAAVAQSVSPILFGKAKNSNLSGENPWLNTAVAHRWGERPKIK